MKKELSFILSFLLCLSLCACGNTTVLNETAPVPTEVVAPTETVVITEPESSIATTAPVVIRISYYDAAELFPAEFDKFHALIRKVNEAIDYYRDNDFTTIEDIRTYESMWKNMSDRARAIESTLLENTPPEEYEDVWSKFADCMGQIADIFAKGANMDANHDNTCTGDEMTQLIVEIRDEFVDVARTACDLAIELEDISEDVSEEITTSEDVESDEHVCAVCGLETQLFYKNPILGVTEYYCETHHKKMVDTMNSMMEHKVEQPSQNSQSSTNNSQSSTNSYSGSSARHTDSEAFSCAKAIVKGVLKSPSSAKFCWITDATVTHLGNGEYKVTGWVEAENSFGATLRQNFVVVYTATENGYKNGTAVLS